MKYFIGVTKFGRLTKLIGEGINKFHKTTPTRSYNISQKKMPIPEGNMSKYRLPECVRPSLYNLYLYPDLETGLFKGKVSISISVSELTDSISVHSNSLNISKVAVNGKEGSFEVDRKHELVEIRKKDGSSFNATDKNVEIEFSGDMKNRIVGLYTSKYTSSSGVTTTIATSKFEPTYARQAYPCFDEPNMKAKYVVHLLKPKKNNYTALSNYPIEKIEPYDEKSELVTFQETVSMSTYLTCFIVSDFIYTETQFENDGSLVPLKVYASPENLQKTTYAGYIGKNVIEYYVKYFGIPYPLPKLDMVAIPDFVSGAMEHWGLVTYRETALLYTNATHSSVNKRRVATVVAHELAHSWFGNLVTMDWWNDLWLNEGFATYIEFKGVDAVERDWDMMTQFPVMILHSVLSDDAVLSSHPIVQTVVTPDQITAIFDSISYNKGASILRMLENTVGEASFQKGVTNYLKKYAYSNAKTKNFLDEIQAVVGDKFNVAELIDTFTVQMGYPVLQVTGDGNRYTLTQKRFLKDPNATFENDVLYGYKWTVPVTYVTDTGKSNELILFKHDSPSITIDVPAGAKYVKFNYDQVGYYRVNYEPAMWSNLIDHYSNMSAADRAHLIEEVFSLAEAGQVGYQVALDFTKKLEGERSYTPWNAAYDKLTDLLILLNESPKKDALKDHISIIVSNAYEHFGWNETAEDSVLTRLTRAVVLNLACSVDHEDCLNEAEKQFDKWIQTGEPLSQDLRSIVYKYGIKQANESTWEKLLTVYKQEQDASEKVKLSIGLANTENTDLLKRLLELAKDENIVRRQDFLSVIQYVSVNHHGTDLVWDWYRENWPYLVDAYGLNDRNLGRLIVSVTKSFSTVARYEEIEAFFKKYPDAGAGVSSRKRALETVKNNIKWQTMYRNSIEDWISKLREA